MKKDVGEFLKLTLEGFYCVVNCDANLWRSV